MLAEGLCDGDTDALILGEMDGLILAEGLWDGEILALMLLLIDGEML